MVVKDAQLFDDMDAFITYACTFNMYYGIEKLDTCFKASKGYELIEIPAIKKHTAYLLNILFPKLY